MNLYIDIAISLILVFLILSIIVYVIQELVAVNLEYRSDMLWRSLAKVLDDAVFKSGSQVAKGGLRELRDPAQGLPLTERFFNHPQIKTLQKDADTKPVYIPAENAALALVDIMARLSPSVSADIRADFKAGLAALDAGYKKTNLSSPSIIGILQSVDKISGTTDELLKHLQKWYDEYMKRVTGWYQAHTVVTIRIIAIIVTLAFNVNTFVLVKDIAANSTLRTNLTVMAQGVATHPELLKIDTGKAIKSIGALTDSLSKVNLPMGWTGDLLKKEASIGGDAWGKWNYLLLILGWLVTAGCLSMGAPFWFNLLVQLVNVRRAGIKPGGDKKK